MLRDLRGSFFLCTIHALAMAVAPGARLGPYEILTLIGKGGMGEVWRARDPRLGRDVAIKVADARFSERFEREAKAIAALESSQHLPDLRRWPGFPGHGIHRGIAATRSGPSG